MKNRNHPLAALICLVTALTAILVVGCFGVKARQNVLLPQVQRAWPGVKADATSGPVQPDPVNVAAIDAAVSSGDANALSAAASTNWPDVSHAATVNIASSADKAELKNGKLERVKNLGDALASFSPPGHTLPPAGGPLQP